MIASVTYRLPLADFRRRIKEMEIVFEVSASPDGGFEASAVGHRIHTQGEDWEDLKAMIRDAVSLHFADKTKPGAIRLVYRREEVLSA